MNSLLRIRAEGQQIWLDNLSRTLLNDGHLARLVSEDGLAGVTTNPSIFQKAITDGRYYEEDLTALKALDLDAEARYERLVIPDVQRACDLLEPVFRKTGNSGYVSLEVSPALAHDADATVAAGLRLRNAVARENLLIKVPATHAGLEAIEELISQGVNVNVTLMFSLAHVDAVADAYVRGLQRLCAAGGDPVKVMSVASLFLSRVDTLIDRELEARGGGDALALRGQTAVAMARLAYARYRDRFHGSGFSELRDAGARPQYLLWASTGTKNPAYSDLLYVEPLVGPETVNTLPDATLAALRDHGQVNGATLGGALDEARARFDALERLGIDLRAVGERLQAEGLAQFENAFAQLLEQTT